MNTAQGTCPELSLPDSASFQTALKFCLFGQEVKTLTDCIELEKSSRFSTYKVNTFFPIG